MLKLPSLSRRKLLNLLVASAAAPTLAFSTLVQIADDAKAFWHGFAGPTGRTVLGYGGVNTFQFMNFAKSAASTSGQLNLAGSSPFSNSGPNILLNANGYPITNAPSGYSGRATIPTLTTATQWVMKWRNNVSGSFGFQGASAAGYRVVAVGGTVGGITYSSGGNSVGGPFSFIQAVNATRPRVVFTMDNPDVDLNCYFPTGVTYHGDQDVVICRLSDEAALDAGGIFLPEFMAVMAALKPRISRVMGQILNAGDDHTLAVHTRYRPSVNSFSWFNNTWVPALWDGALSNPSPNVYTSPGTFTDFALLGGAWVEGMTWQGTLRGLSDVTFQTGATVSNAGGLYRLTVGSTTNITIGTNITVAGFGGAPNSAFPPTGANGNWVAANVTATTIDLAGSTFVAGNTGTGTVNVVPTMNLGGLGAKPLIAVGGGALKVDATGGNHVLTLVNSTFVYDVVLDAVLYYPDGIWYGPPLEIRVAQCNALNVDYWHIIPINYTLASSLSDAQYIASNLASLLVCYGEVCNENWNSGFNQFTICALRGRAFGFSPSGGQDYFGYQGLRTKQMFDQFISAFTTAGRLSSFKGVAAFQAFGSPPLVELNFLKGDPLALVASGGAVTNGALWTTYTGNANTNYRSGLNRPVDVCSVLSYAPYLQPAQVGQSDADYTVNIGAANITDLKTNADLYATGNPANMATALAWFDNTTRRGTYPAKTFTISGGDTFNCTAHGFTAGVTRVILSTTGALGANISTNAVYYVGGTVTANSFQLLTALSGSVITGIGAGTGTHSVGQSGGFSLLDYAAFPAAIGFYTEIGIYGHWEAVAARYSKDVVCYEGALQGLAPSTTECGTLGISTSYGDTYVNGNITSYGSIGNLILGYKNSAYGSAFVLSYFQQFMGTDSTQPLTFGLLPHSKQPAWLDLSNSSQWSLYPVSDALFPTPFQTYNGMAAFDAS